MDWRQEAYFPHQASEINQAISTKVTVIHLNSSSNQQAEPEKLSLGAEMLSEVPCAPCRRAPLSAAPREGEDLRGFIHRPQPCFLFLEAPSIHPGSSSLPQSTLSPWQSSGNTQEVGED